MVSPSAPGGPRKSFTRPPATTYIVHGEPDAASALQVRIAAQLKWRAVVAQDGQRVSLG